MKYKFGTGCHRSALHITLFFSKLVIFYLFTVQDSFLWEQKRLLWMSLNRNLGKTDFIERIGQLNVDIERIKIINWLGQLCKGSMIGERVTM
jgi:hypothetical protein